MKKTVLIYVALIFLFVGSAVAEVVPPKEGGVLPEISLSSPKEPAYQDYLGITGKKTFAIPEIKAEVVIVEIFSMYCPFCQKDAPIVNELYRKIAQNSRLKDKIKLIGIGVGNSAFEVDFFRKTYNIAFPLFSDPDFSMYKKIGQVRTPYFIGVNIRKDGTHGIFYAKQGSIENAEKFLEEVVRLSGL